MDLSRLNTAFRRLGIASDASENHGVLSGLLCAQGYARQDEWLARVRGEAGEVAEPDLDDESLAQELAIVGALYEETTQCLNDTGFVFDLLLPEEDQPLTVRADALGAWCRGFLYGLGVGGIEDHTVLPDDVREIIRDVAAISQASVDSGDETDEAAYMELVEYMRAGITLVFEELEAERKSSSGDKVLH